MRCARLASRRILRPGHAAMQPGRAIFSEKRRARTTSSVGRGSSLSDLSGARHRRASGLAWSLIPHGSGSGSAIGQPASTGATRLGRAMIGSWRGRRSPQQAVSLPKSLLQARPRLSPRIGTAARQAMLTFQGEKMPRCSGKILGFRCSAGSGSTRRSLDDESVRPASGEPVVCERRQVMPNHDRRAGARLSSGPEQ